MEQGLITSRQLTQAYLTRIALLDRQGPAINSVIEINPDALSIAERCDQERKSSSSSSSSILRSKPLLGIPILIKDNIDTDDAMQTTAGSLALVGQKVGA